MDGKYAILSQSPDDITVFLLINFRADRASCYFQPELKPGATTGTVSLYKLRDAASALTTECALRKSQGGFATNLGGDGNIVLTLNRYYPAGGLVQCGGSKDALVSCREILIGMPVSRLKLFVGPRANPKSDIGLPFKVNSCMHGSWNPGNSGC